MLITVDSMENPDPTWDESTYMRVLRSLCWLELRDAKGTALCRVQEVDTETNTIKFFPTDYSSHAYVDSNGEAVLATMQIPGLQIWLRPWKDGKAIEPYQVDSKLNPFDPSIELPELPLACSKVSD